MTGSAQIKQKVRRLLTAPDLLSWPPELPPELRQAPVQPLLRALLGGLSASEEGMRWRAVGLIGQAAARLAAEQGLEPVRELLRRLLWGLNEESGGIVWAAPQALGEVLFQVPELAPEYGKILCSYLRPGANYLEHPPLQAAAAWGVGRLAQVAPELARGEGVIELLLPLLEAAHAPTRGAALWALGVLGHSLPAADLARLLKDHRGLLLPWRGRLDDLAVSTLVN